MIHIYHWRWGIKDLEGSSNLTLFIDSSNIYNKYGIDDIGYGFNPKKRESKNIYNM